MPNEWVPVVGSLGGVALGAGITWLRERSKSRQDERKAALYLSVLVGAHLDRFSDECVHVAFDEGEPSDDAHGTYFPTTSLPTFNPLELDVDWKSLPPELMYSVLNIPNRLEQIARQLRDPGYDDPPFNWQFFFDRQQSFAKIGLHVSAIARELRAHVGVTPPNDGDLERNRDAKLREALEYIEESRKAIEAEHADRLASLSSASPVTNSS